MKSKKPKPKSQLTFHKKGPSHDFDRNTLLSHTQFKASGWLAAAVALKT